MAVWVTALTKFSPRALEGTCNFTSFFFSEATSVPCVSTNTAADRVTPTWAPDLSPRRAWAQRVRAMCSCSLRASPVPPPLPGPWRGLLQESWDRKHQTMHSVWMGSRNFRLPRAWCKIADAPGPKASSPSSQGRGQPMKGRRESKPPGPSWQQTVLL